MKNCICETPIDEPLVVLDLMMRSWGDNSSREINRYGSAGRRDAPYIEIGWHHDFSESSWSRLMVTDRVVDDLFARRFLLGRKQWGWTDHKILTISDAGILWLRKTKEELGLDSEFRALEWFERWSLMLRRS